VRITREEYDVAITARKKAEEIIHAFNKQSIEDFNARWERFDHNHEYFKDEDLVYSATARCKHCNAGLAYPKDCGPNHQWTCSNVLKGIGTDKGHDAFPFAFYEITSENQHFGRNETTRPKS